MVIFSELFKQNHCRPVEYGGKLVHMWDRIAVASGLVVLQYRIVSTDSEWKQGLALSTSGVLTFPGQQVVKKGWADLYEHLVEWQGTFTVRSKNGLLAVKNIWDEGRGGTESWTHGAAMWIEEIPNGRRYHCNDGHFDDDFDDIVFELTFVQPGESG